MGGFLQQLGFLAPGWAGLVEIAIVFFLFYRILLFMRDTRAMRMLVGVVFIAGLYLLAVILDFAVIRALLAALLQYGVIAALVVFQPEMRTALTRLGETRLARLLASGPKKGVVDLLVKGAERLARSGCGAIVVVQRETGLRDYAQEGAPVDGQLSAELLESIFSARSPLHDGAVIVVGDRIAAAGVILPLTQNPVADRMADGTLGTRHRAALGLSEETDAVAIVVSEETSRISVAQYGRIETGVDARRLREVLEHAIATVGHGAAAHSPGTRDRA